jgi:hypothetical protein
MQPGTWGSSTPLALSHTHAQQPLGSLNAVVLELQAPSEHPGNRRAVPAAARTPLSSLPHPPSHHFAAVVSRAPAQLAPAAALLRALPGHFAQPLTPTSPMPLSEHLAIPAVVVSAR